MIKLFQFQSTLWIWLVTGLIVLFGWGVLPNSPPVGIRLIVWFIASFVLFILDSDQYKEQTARLQNQVAAAGSLPFDVPAAEPSTSPPSYQDVMNQPTPSAPTIPSNVNGGVYKAWN
tara:strand:+ start:17838 stop:18188 length:351 start_codon:yes stop_codon:yes gene_type:complete